MLVVSPASEISRLDRLTNAEDDARTDAAERADELADAAPTEDIESRVGDSDPVKAIEDALRTFSADELIVVTLPDEEASWLEKGSAETALRRFSLPVTHLVVDLGHGFRGWQRYAGQYLGAATYMTVVAERPSV